MTDEPTQSRDLCFARLFPWLRLFRGVGVSFDPKKLFVAALGLIALDAGWGGLSRIFPDTDPRIPTGLSAFALATDSAAEPFGFDLVRALWHLTEPAQCMIRPFLPVFSVESSGRSLVHGFLAAVWAVIVWGIFGGAIARIATLQVACGERIGVRKALEFALRKWVPLVCGPLSPLLGIALLSIPCLLFGLLYRLPGSIGSSLAGFFLVFPLLAGLVMTLILVGLATGWPLMHASVAAEAEDGFDALSRSYAYVFQRPMRYGVYLTLTWLVGLAGILFVSIFALLVFQMTRWGLSLSAPANVLDPLFQAGPSETATATARAHAFWLSIVRLLAHGWIYAYFWSAASLIYLTIRQDVDGTDWRQVALPEATPHPFLPQADDLPPPTTVAPDPASDAP